MRLLQNYHGKFALKSFHPLSVYYLKKHYPNIIRGQVSSRFVNSKMNVFAKLFLKNMILNFLTKPDFISYDIKCFSPKKIEKWRKKRIVLGWTIRTKQDFVHSKPYFTNLICENMQEYVGKRN